MSTSKFDLDGLPYDGGTPDLMMPGNYATRAHRSRKMPQRKPRLTARESEKSTLAYTSETPPTESH